MVNNTREIRRRIRSVKNIGQITKAMELVSAAKMRKSQGMALASRPYATLSTEMLGNVAAQKNLSNHPLVQNPNRKRLNHDLIILITSSRGLAGAFTTNLINQTLGLIKENQNSTFDFITIGKKAVFAAKRFGWNVAAAFDAKERGVSIYDARVIVEIAIKDYLHEKYDKVFIVYSHFVSTLLQKPTMLQLLPILTKVEKQNEEYLFEPTIDIVLDSLINRLVEFAVYQALVEGLASEHSARMVAMRNANQAASDLIGDLSLTYNQARQSGITRELSEISAAKLAMEG